MVKHLLYALQYILHGTVLWQTNVYYTQNPTVLYHTYYHMVHYHAVTGPRVIVPWCTYYGSITRGYLLLRDALPRGTIPRSKVLYGTASRLSTTWRCMMFQYHMALIQLGIWYNTMVAPNGTVSGLCICINFMHSTTMVHYITVQYNE